jgi:hypothetical protein
MDHIMSSCFVVSRLYNACSNFKEAFFWLYERKTVTEDVLIDVSIQNLAHMKTLAREMHQ